MNIHPLKFLITLIPIALLAGCGGGSDCYYNMDSYGSVSSARVFYPCGMENSSELHHVTTLSGGLSNTKENMYWLAGHLVENNDMVVFAISASSNTSVGNYERAHKSAVEMIESERNNPASPLYLRLDKLALMGYSMGGGAVLNAAHDLGSEVDAVVAMAPWEPSVFLGDVTADTLAIVGENDIVASPAYAEGAYGNLPDGINKAFMKLDNFGHLQWVGNTGSSTNTVAAKQMISAWVDYNLNGSGSALNSLLNPPSAVKVNENNL
ncbi:alpha/beta hydrolase [Ketobacter alkanivorans]|uniref:PET hydrolase/cutinase-like domain-containing protein n=1 Tax=Ketobacter alkanivorans TaxID=1917421 RepID=A0A2K9LQ63_9GAMM|nr:hypothetical protein [Ketobacter alkanivorans]AUM14442.1 hypothetical protein Kalk_19300 [Ketobacter alkanivorans]